MSRVRVAIDVTSLIGPPTGIHQVTRALIGALRARDDVAVRGWLLTARGERPDLGFPVRRSRVPASVALAGWARSGFPPSRFVAGEADVVHGTNFIAPPNPRSVITLQDMTPIAHPEWCEPAVQAMAGAIRRAVRRGATLHVTSDLVRREAIAEFGLTDERVRLVHHAVTPLTGGDDQLGRRIAGGPYLLVLGRVERRKNVAAAVEALHALPDDLRLVVAGPSGNDDEAVDAAISRHRAGRVLRLPELSDHDRTSLVGGADALLWPSHYEGFALPPLEALSIGTPVVATATGALPELIGDTVPLVAPGDPDAFTEAIIAALDTSEEVPVALRDRIKAHSWTDAAAGMTEIYQDVGWR